MDFVADRQERLDAFLVRQIEGQSRSRLAEHISAGQVLVDGQSRKPGFRLEPGMRVSVEEIGNRPMQDLSPEEMSLDILFEDEYLIVVNKPAGLSVHPSPTSQETTLVHGLLAHKGFSAYDDSVRPGIVHRLDKDTSGLMLVAKNERIHRALQLAIQERSVSRIYWAWVKGIPDKQNFTIKSFVGRHPKNRQKMAVVTEQVPDARIAITHCELLSTKAGISKIECKLETGRTHQIRVHLASVGLPILGDRTYGIAHPGLTRQALHAAKLEFTHPITSKEIKLEAPIPSDLSIFASE